MMTVVDQHSPWLTPSRTLANTTQPQLGAQMRSSGTGSAATQPATSSGLRPIRSASRPAKRFASALTMPKLTRNERTTVLEASPNSPRAMSGRTVRSSPTIAPTKALTTTSSVNWRQLAPRPSSGDGAAIGACLELGRITFGERAGFVQRDDPVMVWRRAWDAREDRLDELSLASSQQLGALPDLSQAAYDRLAVEGHWRAGVRGQDRGPTGELEESL